MGLENVTEYSWHDGFLIIVILKHEFFIEYLNVKGNFLRRGTYI
jgi:hypothetical protein